MAVCSTGCSQARAFVRPPEHGLSQEIGSLKYVGTPSFETEEAQHPARSHVRENCISFVHRLGASTLFRSACSMSIHIDKVADRLSVLVCKAEAEEARLLPTFLAFARSSWIRLC